MVVSETARLSKRGNLFPCPFPWNPVRPFLKFHRLPHVFTFPGRGLRTWLLPDVLVPPPFLGPKLCLVFYPGFSPLLRPSSLFLWFLYLFLVFNSPLVEIPSPTFLLPFFRPCFFSDELIVYSRALFLLSLQMPLSDVSVPPR